MRNRNKSLIFTILALAFLIYTFLLYAKPPVPFSAVDARVVKGKATWQQYNCNACHQVYGLGGFLGPDLTNVYAKGPSYIKAFLQSGTAVMPNFKLSEEEKDNLVAYLQHLDGSGNSDPRTFKILPDGSISK